MIVDCRLNVDSTTVRAAIAGGAIPASVPTRGLIDTGSDITAVAPAILQQLAVPIHYHTTTHSIAGRIPVRLFLVTLFILEANNPQLPWLVYPDLLVMELPAGLPFDVFIGMDVLRNGKLILDGPAGRFTLET
jgi:hypothetical protein